LHAQLRRQGLAMAPLMVRDQDFHGLAGRME